MNAIRLLPVLLAIAFSGAVSAQEAEHPLGQHPAIIVKRLAEKQGYDYVSKFYPHPAWMYLSSEAPHPMMDHPAVIIAKREKQRQAEQAPLEASVGAVSGSGTN